MATFLFNDIIFGPLTSRRLGASLGVNLLPVDVKLCNYNCVYCECGWNTPEKKIQLPTRLQVSQQLEIRLQQMASSNERLDVITFAGNGEPTLHPEFSGIIHDTIELRNRFFPTVEIAVLSNATNLHKPEVVNALKTIERNILKLDSAINSTLQSLNLPVNNQLTVDYLVEGLKNFEGHFILQTLFVRGSYNGKNFDNTSPEEIDAWLNVIKQVRPSEVMIYTIARDTPIDSLQKISKDELMAIARKIKELGIKVQVSA